RFNHNKFGDEHPNTIMSFSNLALVLQKLRDYSGAKLLIKKVVIFSEKYYGMNHPNTANSYFNLAAVLKDLNNFHSALEFGEKALEIYKNEMPESHPGKMKVQEIIITVRMLNFEPIGLVLQKIAGYVLKAAALKSVATSEVESRLLMFWKVLRPHFIKIIPKIESEQNDEKTEIITQKILLAMVKEDETFFKKLTEQTANFQLGGIKERTIKNNIMQKRKIIQIGSNEYSPNQSFGSKLGKR